jgi:PAS domain S-box-containing protein
MSREILRKTIETKKGQDVEISRENLNLGFLEFLSEGVMVINSAKQIVGVNSAFEKLLGWTENELVGRPCKLFLNCENHESGDSFCDNFCPFNLLRNLPPKGQTAVYQDLSVHHKKGHQLIVNASLTPLEFNPPENPANSTGQNFLPENGPALPQADTVKQSDDSYYIMVLRNVTEVKRQERIQSEFISAASHQLRTPLASIKTSIGLLLANVGSNFNPALEKLLQNVQSSSLRMERLVNDLIELASLQNGQVKMQPQVIEAQELVYQAIKLNSHRLKKKNQNVKKVLPHQPLFVKADFFRMSQVLEHLLSNASKFSQPGQTIELKIAARSAPNNDHSEAAEEVIFSVRDKGIGIAPEEQALVYGKFYQSQVFENTAEQGAGLGLPLAKVLIELNGGRLWFESEPDKGTTFYFSLPAAQS